MTVFSKSSSTFIMEGIIKLSLIHFNSSNKAFLGGDFHEMSSAIKLVKTYIHPKKQATYNDFDHLLPHLFWIFLA